MRLKIFTTLSNFFCKRSPDPVASLLTNRVENIFKNVDYCLIQTTVQAYFFFGGFFFGGGREGGTYTHQPQKGKRQLLNCVWIVETLKIQAN